MPFDQVTGLTVQYDLKYCSYDRMELTVTAAGETCATGPCRLKGEVVEDAAATMRRRVEAAGGHCGSAQADRELRLAQMHSIKEIAIAALLGFLTLFLIGAAWIAADIPEDLRFRFRAVDAQGTFVNEWMNEYTYPVGPGDVRLGSSGAIREVANKEGDTFPIRYYRGDPKRSHLLIELPILSSRMYALCALLGLAAAGLLYLTIRSCQGHIACYGRGKFFFIHPGELEDDYLRGT